LKDFGEEKISRLINLSLNLFSLSHLTGLTLLVHRRNTTLKRGSGARSDRLQKNKNKNKNKTNLSKIKIIVSSLIPSSPPTPIFSLSFYLPLLSPFYASPPISLLVFLLSPYVPELSALPSTHPHPSQTGQTGH
jgi:hypothetical protein